HLLTTALVAGVGEGALVARDAGQPQVWRGRNRVRDVEAGRRIAGTGSSTCATTFDQHTQPVLRYGAGRMRGQGFGHQFDRAYRIGPHENLELRFAGEFVGDPP